MFRITQYIAELLNPPVEPPPAAPRRRVMPGPVVIWNLIRRCNLACKHCYTTSADIDFPGELDTDAVFAVMDDLKAFRVPVLILSGGEPLLRPDIFAIAQRAKAMGFYVGLSSNGTLITEQNIAAIAATGFDYVGVSIDGMGKTHDDFRQSPGSFERSLHGVRLCRERDIKVGLRFTLTRDNHADLPALLDLMEREGVDKFYLSHLNYGGRGHRNRKDDAVFATTRAAMDLLFDTCLARLRAGRPAEFVTGNNDADGVYLLHWASKRFPDQAGRLRARLAQWGGNASGVNIANIDNLGNVHPDTFWWHYRLGNVRERPFSEIWRDVSDPLMAGLKASPRPVQGRCAECAHLDLCNGNTRVRAHQTTGDFWAEDPGCYLADDEIGLQARDR
ncbi:heme d1 biosynthesis radical SAM protein NirJ [Methylomagnum ishizawai]|uniref:Pre-heme d1 synthase n=1 Tax=Methylomagnum ishizawai TaxID=1760988 RepID=A0A1Y6CW35_9GAMM|nr:heme d1 biosynthesis radical SAM protein NirJ [Methylomagnum ishizawai]SMF94571.1 heme d1 biosynthesis radical SAM protein NirJ [Methylomagnum ishizawai]